MSMPKLEICEWCEVTHMGIHACDKNPLTPPVAPDSLVARLREWRKLPARMRSLALENLMTEAADRIEQQDRELVAARDCVRVYAEHAGKLEAAEARLARIEQAADVLAQHIRINTDPATDVGEWEAKWLADYDDAIRATKD